MTDFYHNVDFYHDKKRVTRAKRLTVLILLIFAVLLCITGVIYWTQARKEEPVPVSTLQVKGAFTESPRKQYENEHFYFDSSKEWQFVRSDSNVPYKYTYTGQKDGYATCSFTVYLKSKRELPVQYAQVVEVIGNKVKVLDLSPRCNDPKATTSTIEKVFNNAKYICETQSSREVIGVSASGGDQWLMMKNSVGETIPVTMTFLSHRSDISNEVLVDLLSNFRLK